MVLLFNPQYFTFGHYKQYFVHQLYISSKESCSRRHVYYPVSDTWRVSPPSHVSRLWDCCLLLVISVDTNFVFYRNWISFKNNKNCKILSRCFIPIVKFSMWYKFPMIHKNVSSLFYCTVEVMCPTISFIFSFLWSLHGIFWFLSLGCDGIMKSDWFND